MPAHWYYSVHGECLEKGKYRHPDCIVYGLHVLNGGYAAGTSLGSGRPVFVPTHFSLNSPVVKAGQRHRPKLTIQSGQT